jgi:two-component system, OmpR family, sensor histidine kinase SenX3
VTRRQKAIAFFVAFCVLLVAAALSLNIGWIVINARSVTPLIWGIVAFVFIIAGIIVYTVFLVMEIKRNEDHDTFLNAVTHELKTPIASIKLYLETLQSRSLSEEQRKHFYEVMLADTDRLHRTVDQVLKAGVVREKRKEAARVPVDISALARETVDLALVRHHLPPSAIELQMQSEQALVVMGDPDDLRMVVSNLLDNAVKYSGEKLQVTVTIAAPSPETVWVRVHDRGVGIPRAQLKRIFRRFYRVQARGLKQVKGSGLGLYIVRAIARAHGGRVFAQSEGEGHGATFTVELPRATAHRDALASTGAKRLPHRA